MTEGHDSHPPQGGMKHTQQGGTITEAAGVDTGGGVIGDTGSIIGDIAGDTGGDAGDDIGGIVGALRHLKELNMSTSPPQASRA